MLPRYSAVLSASPQRPLPHRGSAQCLPWPASLSARFRWPDKCQSHPAAQWSAGSPGQRYGWNPPRCPKAQYAPEAPLSTDRCPEYHPARRTAPYRPPAAYAHSQAQPDEASRLPGPAPVPFPDEAPAPACSAAEADGPSGRPWWSPRHRFDPPSDGAEPAAAPW